MPAASVPRGRLRPTKSAWKLGWLGIGLLGAAVNTGNNLIYLMFSLLVAGVLVSAVAVVANVRQLRFAPRLPGTPSVGAPFAIDVDVTNERRRLASCSIDVTLITDQGEYGPLFVARIRAGESVRLTFPGRGARRGPLSILGLAVRSAFPLGLVERRVFREQRNELLVLPRAEPSATRVAASSAATGSAALSPRLPGSEYHGLRAGTDEDDARRIDWKVTARRGVLMVRETAGERRHEIRLNLRSRVSGNPVAARRSFERRISRISGAGRSTLLDGGLVRMSVDDAGTERYSGPADVLRLLRRLAEIEPTTADGTAIPRAGEPRPPTRAPVDEGVVRASLAGRVHRYSALAALAVGSVALLAFGAISPIGFLLLTASWIATTASDRLVAGGKTAAGRLWQVAAVGALVAFAVDLIWIRNDLLASSSSLLIFVTLLAMFNSRTAHDDRRLLLISFVHIVLAAALTTEFSFAAPLLAWLYAAVVCLIAWVALPGSSATQRFGATRQAAAVVPALLVVGALVYLLVPHLGTGTFRPTTLRPQRMSGFSDSARLGDIGRIKLDRSKVMEVEIDDSQLSGDDLKWRGVTLSRFDGRGWSRGTPYPGRVPRDTAGRLLPSGGAAAATEDPRQDSVTQIFRLEPTGSTAIFAAARPRIIESGDFKRMSEDRSGNLELFRRPGRRLTYTVTSEPAPREPRILRSASGPDPEPVSSIDLELPVLDPRIAALADEITADAPTRYDAAVAIERWLSERLDYTLAVNDVGAADPLARFLFDGAPGHCEYFATSMVVLARSAGIPARFAAGYLRGARSRFGERYIVRQSDAHSWVEIYFPRIGWVSFDPTPPAGRSVTEARGIGDLASFVYSSVTRLWDDYVVGIDLDDQARAATALLNGARGTLARVATWPWPRWIAGLLLLAAIAAALRGLRGLRTNAATAASLPGSDRDVPSFYLTLLELLESRDLRRAPHETPAELAERSESFLGPRGLERVRDLTQLYYRVRFDGSTAERSVRRIARALLDDVRQEMG